MDHVLTVGEIYDKAVDLCLRNALTIALSLGAFFVSFTTLSVLNSTFRNDLFFSALHIRPRDALLPGEWVSVVVNAAYFLVLPAIGALLCVLFDRSIRRLPTALRDCLTSPRRTAKVILASFFGILITIAAAIPGAVIIFVTFGHVALPIAATIALLLGSCVSIWPITLLTLGAAAGYVRVALDEGRVYPSISLEIRSAFARSNQLRVLAVGLPLLIVFTLGTYGGWLGGIEAYELTGSDALNVALETIGNVVAYGLLAAVATVYYRNTLPVHKGKSM